MRYAPDARFCTDMQNPTSIKDPLRVCRGRCDREGWTFVGACEDRGITGATRLRLG